MPFIQITSDGADYLINVDQITFIEEQSNGCMIHLYSNTQSISSKSFFIKMSLSAIKEMIKTASLG